MTKKDYELIEQALVAEFDANTKSWNEGNITVEQADQRYLAICNVGFRLNGMLASNDPKFDEYKFKKAVGLN